MQYSGHERQVHKRGSENSDNKEAFKRVQIAHICAE